MRFLPPLSSIRPRLARLLVAVGLVLLMSPPARAADDVLVWNRNGIWQVAAPVDLFLGDLFPVGTWKIGLFAFTYPDANDPTAVASVIGGVDLGRLVMADGETSGKNGLKLKMAFTDPEHGDGALTLLMDPGLHRFVGKVKFKNLKSKGEFVGVYDRYSANIIGRPDSSDLALRVAFSEKQKAKGLKPGGTATVLVALQNFGPQPFHVGIQDLSLVFEFAPGSSGDPFPVEILKILTIDGIRGFDLELAPDTFAPLRLPMSIKDALILGVKFAVPVEAAGHVLTVRADLPPVDPGEPNPIVHTDEDSIQVNGVTISFKLQNTQDQNPIHIALDDGRTAAEQFTEDNRVAPGGSRKLKVTDLRVGEELVFIAGRSGTIFSRCSGRVRGPGKATITWNPTLPTFLRLSCG